MFTQCGWRLRKRSGDYIEREWERESCWEEEFFFLDTFGRLWPFVKTDFKLVLSIGGKSPVFPVACGVGHCFISCEGLATRSGYPTVQVGAERNRNHHFRCCFDLFLKWLKLMFFTPSQKKILLIVKQLVIDLLGNLQFAPPPPFTVKIRKILFCKPSEMF